MININFIGLNDEPFAVSLPLPPLPLPKPQSSEKREELSVQSK